VETIRRDSASLDHEPIEGAVAVVTGASKGIGKAIALGLAVRGASLCLVGRNAGTLEDVVESTRRSANRVISYPTDITLDMDRLKLVSAIKRDFGHVDILVHAAGIISLARLEDALLEDFDRQYQTNVRAPFALTQALLPLLRSRQGQIVFINSSTGLNAKPGVGQYAATKHALKAIADSLRAEVNADGLRVSSVFLGRTATPMQATIHEMEDKPYQPERLLQPQDVAAAVIHLLSLPRTAEVTDISIRPFRKFD